MTQPNNNVSEIDPSLRIYEFYPNRHTATVEYDDDGVTEAYRQEKSVSTLIESNVDAKNRVTITIHPTAGSFDGFVKDKDGTAHQRHGETEETDCKNQQQESKTDGSKHGSGTSEWRKRILVRRNPQSE